MYKRQVYIGRANYFLYDHPTRGFVWLPHDLDGAFDYLPVETSPLYPTCSGRTVDDRLHYNLVVGDPTWAATYVAAIADARATYDPDDLALRVDQWSAQIAAAATDDPHKPFTDDVHVQAVAALRAYPRARAAIIDAWLACREAGGPDADADGADTCHDCDDADPAAHPGATETCNGADDDCDGIIDVLADGSPCP